MSKCKLLREITIPDYPSKILVAKSRATLYYKKGKTKKPIPNKYSPKLHPKEYGFNKKDFLINLRTQERVVRNPRAAGTPRFWVVNFQDIWNQVLQYSARGQRVDALKKIIKPYITPIKAIEKYPVRIEIFLYDTEMNVDVDNKGVIYTKVVTDLLVRGDKMIDDSAQYVNDTGRCKYINVKTVKERKMVIKIWESN